LEGEVKIKKIYTYDIVSNPGFKNVRWVEHEIERIRIEKLRKERKEKLDKINEINEI